MWKEIGEFIFNVVATLAVLVATYGITTAFVDVLKHIFA